MSDLIGKSLGSYRILEQIGVGGMATVYKAYQPSMDRYVAIKVLPHYLAADEQFVHRFQREARAIAKLEHPHILPIFDYGEHDGVTYIAMRYVEAGTLKDYLAQKRPTLTDISEIIAQVGGALAYAHEQGIIHRDVKPGNILIDSQGNTYLTDFGLARIMESSQQFTASGVSVGTPAYMSPEQGKGVRVDHRSDIYALGVMVYEMVTGRVPFEAETPLAVLLKHITEPLPLPRRVKPGIPEQVELVILKALAKEPGDRFQSANELAQALVTAVSHTTPSATQIPEPAATEIKPAPTAPPAPTPEPVSLVTRAQHTWQTSRGKAIMIGGTAVILILFGFLINWLNRLDVAISGRNGETPVVQVEVVEEGEGAETAVTQPTATATIQPTTMPAALPVGNLQLRLNITSTSDWAEVSLLPGVEIINQTTVETGGETLLAAMRDRIIDLDQEIELAAEGHSISIVQDITLNSAAEDETIRLAIEKGCIGITTVEVFNVVTGVPLLLDRFTNNTCNRATYTVATNMLVTADIPPTPTNEPARLKEIYPLAPSYGQVINLCEESISASQICLHNLATHETFVFTVDLNFTELGALAWSPNGLQILISAAVDQSERDLYIVNVDGTKLRQLTDSEHSDDEGEWSPNGEWIIFERDCAVWRIRPDGADEQLLLHSNDYCVEVSSWSPDSRKIAYTTYRDGAVRSIWVANADGSNPQQVYAFDTPPRSGAVVWLPDGERILSWFWLDGNGEEQRVLVYADGSGVAGTIGGVPYWWQRNYTPRWGIETEEGKSIGDCREAEPSICIYQSGQHTQVVDAQEFESIEGVSWSPDGQQIAFAGAAENQNYNIYVVNADGSDLRQITTLSIPFGDVDWSLDGEWIAFTALDALWRVHPDGSDEQILLEPPDNRRFAMAQWSPDSQQLSIFSDDADSTEIWVVERDGTNPHIVYSPEKPLSGHGGAVWSSDGQQMSIDYQEGAERLCLLINIDGSGEVQKLDHCPETWGQSFWPRWGD